VGLGLAVAQEPELAGHRRSLPGHATGTLELIR